MPTVEDVIATQQQIAAAIEQLYTNFKKDGEDRKSTDYIKRRVDTLDNYWQEFQANHTNLCGSGIKLSHSYFTSNQFDVVKERYGIVRSAIQNYQLREESRASTPMLKPATPLATAGGSQLHTPQHTASLSRGINSKTDEMLRKQASNYRAFQRAISSIDLDSLSEKWEYNDLLQTLQSRWSVIDALHWELDSELEGSNRENEEVYSRSEHTYNNIKKAINKRMITSSFRDKSTPQMEIPTFGGYFQQWTAFKDLFTETIHNNSALSGAQKMQFLKGKVRGEAERLIQHLPISSDNYSACWNILNHRYNNKKLIFTSHANTLLNIPSNQKPLLHHIKRMHDTTFECLNAIKNLGIDISSWDPLIVHILSQKLDAETHSDYVQSLKEPRELPTLKDFLEFLESKFITLETSLGRTGVSDSSIKSSSNNNHNQQSQQKSQHNIKQTYSTSNRQVTTSDGSRKSITQKYKCPVCNSFDHGIFYCQRFLNMSPDNKKKTVSRYNLCNNCLYDHYGKACISDKRCRTCNNRHNTILHDAYEHSHSTPNTPTSSNYSNTTAANSGQPPLVHRNSHVSLVDDTHEVLLPTALIMVQGVDGTLIKMRALLDQGSQTSLITESAAQQLGLPRKKIRGMVSGVGAKDSSCRGAITINCKSMHTNYSFHTEVFIMKSLINNLPNITLAKPTWPCLENIQLADPEFYISRPVDLLLGGEVYSEILLEGICKSNAIPTAQQTTLGWILCGKAISTLQCNVVLKNFDDIKKFWEIEDISVDQQSKYTSEEQKCIELYKSTTIRRHDGRYEVRLPLKSSLKENLGNSKSKAIAQFKQLERKFTQHKIIANDYKIFVNEYLALGHMIPANRNTTLSCYLPHHCVHKPDSATTKLRVVFNASSKTSSGHSLNDLMETGPNLQQDLQTLLIKWRQFRFAFTADIEKMFRQIWLNEQDQDLQRIIWRDSPAEQIREYSLATVTYGTKAAPYLAMMTLRQLAQDESVNYPDSPAIKILEQSLFMDDLIYGCQSIETGKQIQTDLINILRSGGFNLRKWKSNAPELLEEVDSDQNKQESYYITQTESTKILGIRWNPVQDTIHFEYKSESSLSRPTKRTLLSDISKIFDPLGWLAPITIKLKILFQRVWLLNINWDESLPRDISEEWQKIKKDLRNINQYSLHRWMRTDDRDQIELHGFCDASIKAYSCVIYCRIKNQENISVVLVAGKTRLVPISKSVSLPRLELCGAVLLSKLMAKVTKCLSNCNIKTHCWTDSMVVMGWLNGDVNRWKPFVANRVSEVTENLPADQWHYVKSEENPADCASRGLSPSQLKHHAIWWKGPTWLLQHNAVEREDISIFTTNQEEKKSKKINVVTKQEDNNSIIQQLINKYSSYIKIVRVLAWIRRFINKKQNQQKYQTYLSLEEIRKANTILIKYIQQQAYSAEISDLNKDNSKIKISSKILNLNPFLDKAGILRVGGRLKNAYISDDMKHPIIIPNNTRFTDLIIDYGHELTLHGGPKLTSAFLRHKYWLVGGNRAIEKRLRMCITCRKYNPDKHYQLMGDLPAARCNPCRPFYHTGVDYTGFIDVKANKGRGIKTTKGYVAVFVCMATKAIHLELVSDLSTSAFLSALRRMAARRGTPRHIYSDNGTNFLGASRILEQQFNELQQGCMKEIAEMEINWHFNAPAWPSAGGLWEASVKSLKYHMKRVIGEQKLTYEELMTVLAQIEACLNSRPLCSISEDPRDLDYLTPSHFLASGPNLTLYAKETDLRIRWHLAQQIYQDIWKRWQSEYLSQMNARSKWKQPQENLQIDDLVLIHDPHLPPGKWALARVMELHPGQDGCVRVVTVRTKNGFMKRPITKLSILPVHETQQNKQTYIKAADQAKRNNQSTKKRYNFTTMAITFLLFFMTLISPSQCLYSVKQMPNNQSLYFDKINNMQLIRDEWNLVVYFDMNPYWDGMTALTKHIDYLQQRCSVISKQSQCEGILLQLRHGYQEMKHYDTMLLNQHFDARTRHKRGLIDGVGYLANSLFGVLDSRFAEKYENDINAIKSNQNHMVMLWKNQTSIVEAEFNLLKRTENIIEKQHKAINMKLNGLENALNKVQIAVQNESAVIDFTLSALIAHNLLYQLKEIQDRLIDSITDLSNGKFNPHLISPDQLNHELTMISGRVSAELALPVDETSFSKIYHLLRVRARMSQDYFIFEIRIPLVARESYEILKIIPLPHQSNINDVIRVRPISEYVAINLNKEVYLPLSEGDLSLCIPQTAEKVLCTTKVPIYNMKDDHNLCLTERDTSTCKTIRSPCKNTWTEIHEINSYLYYCCNQCRLRFLCQDDITTIQLTNSGLLTIGQGCTIKSNDFTVHSHKQQSNRIDIKPDLRVIEIAPINHIINISIPNSSLSSTDLELNHRDLINIKNQLDAIKQSTPLSEAVSSHDIHHYAAIYSLAGMMSIIGITLVWRRLRRRPTRDVAPETAARVAEAAHPQPAVRTTSISIPHNFDCVKCGERVKCSQRAIHSESDLGEVATSTVGKKDKGTSPILLKSVFTISED